MFRAGINKKHWTPFIAMVNGDKFGTGAGAVVDKDFTGLQIMIDEAAAHPNSIFHYAFPYKSKGYEIFWTGTTFTGEPLKSYIPKEYLIPEKDTPFKERSMEVHFNNGSIIRVIDFDNPDAAVGQNARGVFFSEFALNERGMEAWQRAYMPMFRQNTEYDCWAIFASTPRSATGKYFKQLYQVAEKDPARWFSSTMTIADLGVYNHRQVDKFINEDRRDGMSEATILEDYFCEWDVPDESTYWGQQLMLAQKEYRITNVPYNSSYLVHTACDIGNDSSVFWFFQQLPNGTLNFIDYMEDKGKGLDYYIQQIKLKPYVYGTHLGPHDLSQRQRTYTDMTLHSFSADLGLYFQVMPKPSKRDQIIGVRKMLGHCFFDENKCAEGLEHIKQYSGTETTPKHDSHSHAADALQVAAIGEHQLNDTFSDDDDETRPTFVESQFDIFNYH